MKEACPLVSIAMPVFNAERTLTLSVRSILKQTSPDWELIIIDDGSRDETLTFARTFKDARIKVIVGGSNKGLPARLNQAVSMAKGRYVARMDQDDIAYPERLETQVRYMANHPEVDLVGSWVAVFHGAGNLIGKRSSKRCSHAGICRYPQKGFPLAHPTWLGKSEWFRAHPYRAEAIMTEDQDLLLRTYASSQFACIPQILLGYREESLSLKKILRSRFAFSMSLLREVRTERRYSYLIGLAWQVLMASLDVFAVATGLDYKVLKHRGGNPLDQDEVAEWNAVWASCNLESPRSL